VAIQQAPELGAGDQAPRLGLGKRLLELAKRKLRGEVEQRAGGRGHRDAGAGGHLPAVEVADAMDADAGSRTPRGANDRYLERELRPGPREQLPEDSRH
jgi:hypothetical protein